MYRPPTISIETFVGEVIFFGLYNRYKNGPRIGLRELLDIAIPDRQQTESNKTEIKNEKIGEKKTQKKAAAIAKFLRNPDNGVSCCFAFVSGLCVLTSVMGLLLNIDI